MVKYFARLSRTGNVNLHTENECISDNELQEPGTLRIYSTSTQVTDYGGFAWSYHSVRDKEKKIKKSNQDRNCKQYE